MPDPAADYLRSLNTSDRVRAAAWDAVYAPDDATAQKLLQQLPFSDDVRAALWDLRGGGTLSGTPQAPTPASPGQFTERQPQPEGSAVGRFVGGAAEMLNPVTMARGLYQAVRHPLDTGATILQQQGAQFTKAAEDYERGRYSEMIGHAAAGAIPLIGPAAAEAGEQVGSGDVAGGLGKATGLLAPVVGAKPALKGAKKLASPALRETVAGALESGAQSRVADVISPKVGPNKTRFGNQAERVAPQLARDLATDGAPITREGYHAQVGQRLSQAEQGLDAATDARLSARSFETKPLIDALLEKRRQLTSEAVVADRPVPEYRGRAARVARDSEFHVRPDAPFADSGLSGADVPPPARGYRTPQEGRFTTEPQRAGVPIGQDVVPGPNAARVAVIDQAIRELQQLGPVTRYEPIRRIRQAYDGPAKTVYSPSMTADYLKAQGGKLGAADVTGTLREALAQWDPETAAANADYSLYRTADDVMQAAAETERTRPRVGRQIMARLTGVLFGQQAAGVPGAVAGYVGGPLVDSALASGATTKLMTARTMQRLADAIRAGDAATANSLITQLEQLAKRELKTTAPVQVERSTSPSEYQPSTAPALAQ